MSGIWRLQPLSSASAVTERLRRNLRPDKRILLKATAQYIGVRS